MTGRQTNYRRNMRIHVLRLLTSLSLLLLPSLGSLAATPLSSNVDSTLQLKPEPRGLRRVFEAGIPLIGMGIGYNLYNNLVRDVRRSHTPWFRYRYDDYTQFAPLVAQLGLRMVSVEGESKSWCKMLTADAFATTTMLGVVTATKYLTQVARPDGSANNSFPSGHTAMAFTAATLLHLEYGERYPWLSTLAYTASTITGVGRILNNRHWVGDVVTGAGVGIVSAHLGYWLSDMIFGGNSLADRENPNLLLGGRLQLDIPVQYGLASVEIPEMGGNRLISTSVGLGIQYFLGSKGYLTRLEMRAQHHKLEHSSDKLLLSSSSGLNAAFMLGREFKLYKDRLCVGLAAGGEVYLPRDAERHWGQLHWSPKLQLASQVRFSPHLALRGYASYLYTPDTITLSAPLGSGSLRVQLPRWSIGSSIVLSL